MKIALILFALLLIGLPFTVHSQDSLRSEERKKGVNVYFDYTYYFEAQKQVIGFSGLSYSYWGKKNNQHGLLFNSFAFNNKEVELYSNTTSKDSVSQTELEASIGYQYTQNLLKNKKSKWQPQIGLMWRFVFYFNKEMPINFNGWERKKYWFSNYFTLLPQITYHANDLIKLTLSMPIDLIFVKHQYATFSQTFRPNFPQYTHEFGYTYTQFQFGDILQIRIGVGIKF